MAHRPRHPQELEPRFRRPVEVAVEHRLPMAEQAGLEEALAQVRASHQSIHAASFVLGEALAYQSAGTARAARQHLRATIAAAAAALEHL